MAESANVIPMPEQTEARKIAGLAAGRIVLYVMVNGDVRPMIVVNPEWSSGAVNGVLFFDGSNDRDNHPIPLVAGPSGHAPECARWITSARYDDSQEPAAGTWHFPTSDPRQTVAMGLIAHSAFDTFTADVMATVNEKLRVTMESVNEMLESHDKLIAAAIGNATREGTTLPAPGTQAPADAQSPAQPTSTPASAAPESPQEPSPEPVTTQTTSEPPAGS